MKKDIGWGALTAIMTVGAGLFGHGLGFDEAKNFYKATNVRGFIGCVDGHLNLRNIDFFEISLNTVMAPALAACDEPQH